MIVKINPADVVSIPSDYHNAKGRACRYEVIGEHAYEDREAFNTTVWRDHRDPDIDTGVDYDAGNDWQAGYDAGEAAARRDSDDLRGYNNDAPSDGTQWSEGYSEGYSDTYSVDWADVGYHEAELDIISGNGYDDTPHPSCDDRAAYQEGYADGWRDGKVARI
jgi:hypothetical protein